MLERLKQSAKWRLAHAHWFQSLVQAPWVPSFEPYVKTLDIRGIGGRFLFATPQAKAWYDPLKPYAKLEYEWVIENVPLKGQKILDAGAHHGQYSVVFALAAAPPAQLVAVDPYPMNCALTELNLLLNGVNATIEECAVAATNGEVHFERQSNGQIIAEGGFIVPARTLDSLLPDADVIKLDVEGAEYSILPAAIDSLPSAHTWIVEIHPIGNPHPDQLITLFQERGYEVFYVNRDSNVVEPYRLNTDWKIHSTVFARRSQR
jgi:FkbM family methyltransferase